METVLITGGTGMIGKALTSALLEKGYEVIVLTRSIVHGPQTIANSQQLKAKNPQFANWNLKAKFIDRWAIEKADHIIHLAGASVAEKRWTKKRKQEILSSRAESGKLIIESLKTIPNQVRTVIGISGIGYYGPDRSKTTGFIETHPAYDDFLSRVCQQWEESLQPVLSMRKRLVILRTGMVLSKEGGALKEFLKPLRFGVATILGSGKQVISWIQINDLVRIFISAIENENLLGIYNAVAPEPVTNKKFVIELAKIKNRKYFIPFHVPSFLLRSILGEMSIEVLKSATVSSGKIIDAGFTFQFPDIRSSVKNIVKKDPGTGPG
jgi:uncharacterized protein